MLLSADDERKSLETYGIFRHGHGFEAGVGEMVGLPKAKMFEILLHQTSILLHQKFMFHLHQKIRLKVSKMHNFHVFLRIFAEKM